MSKIFELHDLVINSESRTVRKGGETLKLHDLTYELLLGLVSSAPEPLNLDSLAERVWKAPHVSNDTVAQRIALLRKALGDDPKEPKYIRTVRGSGYGVIGPVRVLNEAPPAMPSKPRLPFAMVLGFALAVLTLGASVFWLWSTQTQEAEMQDETLEVDERSPNAVLIERAQAQLSLHQPKETQRALVMLRTAVEREPDSLDARLALALALVTSATKFQGDIDEKNEAEAIARDLTETHPEHSDVDAVTRLWRLTVNRSPLGQTMLQRVQARRTCCCSRETCSRLCCSIGKRVREGGTRSIQKFRLRRRLS